MIKSNLSKAKYAIAATLSLMLCGVASAADKPFLVGGAALVGVPAAILETPTAVVVQTPKAVVKLDTDPAKAPVIIGRTDWAGLGWGIGIATNFDAGGSRVFAAQPVNGIVRITDTSSNVSLGFVLEAHYFLQDFTFSGISGGGGGRGKKCLSDDIFCVEVAHGPFVAIEVGGGKAAAKADGLVTAYVLGWMMGLRHPNFAATSPNSSWNLGVGLRIDPSAQVLGDGFVANQPLPPNETAIRFRNEPRVGVTVLSSFSF
jgi:hypothetical protein